MPNAMLGFQGKLYRLTTGTRATWGAAVDGVNTGAAPSNLSEITNCKDITVPMEDGEGDVTVRGSNGFKLTVGTLTDSQIEITMVHDTTDAHYLALLKAKLTRGTVALAVLDRDKATAGANGLWADFSVLKLEAGQELDGVQTDVFMCKPTFSAVGPEWVAVPPPPPP